MGKIFISHSSQDNVSASELYDWLIKNGWDDIFFDVSTADGIAAGELWQEELRRATHHCDAVIAVISRSWINSVWCRSEAQTARLLGKRVFPIVVEDIPLSELPSEIRGDFQSISIFSDPLAFEKLKEGLSRAGFEASTFSFTAGRSPYPGLSPLEEEDAAVFLGRDSDIVRCLDKIRVIRERSIEDGLLIVGASGSGKSSFLRAGIIPRLKRDDNNYIVLPVVRPGGGVVSGKDGFADRLWTTISPIRRTNWDKRSELPPSRASLNELLKDHRSSADLFSIINEFHIWKSVSSDISARRFTFVFPIDQAEELLSPDFDKESDQLLSLINYLSSHVKIIVVLTVRSDISSHLLNHLLAKGFILEHFTLPYVSDVNIEQIIRGPSRIAMPRFDLEPKLVDALIQDARNQDALPLLAFVLWRLYHEYLTDGTLLLSHYNALGGIHGALINALNQSIADSRAIRTLPSTTTGIEKLIAENIFPPLCRIDDSGVVVRRIASIAAIPPVLHPVLHLLAARRVLIIDAQSVAGVHQEIVQVAHEAIFRTWPLFVSWLSRESGFLAWHSDLERLTSRWPAAIPAERRRLVRAVRALDVSPEWISRRAVIGIERAFIEFSRGRRRLTVAYLTAMLPVLISYAFQPLASNFGFDGASALWDRSASFRVLPNQNQAFLIGVELSVISLFVIFSARIFYMAYRALFFDARRAIVSAALSGLLYMVLLIFSFYSTGFAAGADAFVRYLMQ